MHRTFFSSTEKMNVPDDIYTFTGIYITEQIPPYFYN